MDKEIILSFEVLRKHIKILAEEYKPDNVANNYICYKMETLNDEDRTELYKICKETHRKVQRIMEDEKYKGDTPTFFAEFADILFLEEPKNKRNGAR